MKNTFGNSVSLTVFGESHGPEIGAVLDGLAPGIKVDREFIASQMDRRRAKGRISTARSEADEVIISSGVFEGKTTGTPISMVVFFVAYYNSFSQNAKIYVGSSLLSSSIAALYLFARSISRGVSTSSRVGSEL